MYKIMIFVKNMQTNFMVQHKDESLAKAEMENIKTRRKDWFESGKDSLCSISGSDYGIFDITTSEIVAACLIFQADGIQIPGIIPEGRA